MTLENKVKSSTKTWQSLEWKKNKEEFLKANPNCAWCDKPATVPHHPQKDGTLTKEEYISLEGCIPLCDKCHFAIMKGLKLCSVCKEHYFKPSKKKHKDRCWSCFSKTPFGQAVKKYYDDHPKKKRRTLKVKEKVEKE